MDGRRGCFVDAVARHPLAVLAVTVFLAWAGIRLLSSEMFLDGVTYAAIARNLAEGRGTFWAASYNADFTPFAEHPPLAFWLQSWAFRALGDSPWVERLWGWALGALMLVLVARLHGAVRRAVAPGPVRTEAQAGSGAGDGAPVPASTHARRGFEEAGDGAPALQVRKAGDVVDDVGPGTADGEATSGSAADSPTAPAGWAMMLVVLPPIVTFSLANNLIENTLVVLVLAAAWAVAAAWASNARTASPEPATSARTASPCRAGAPSPAPGGGERLRPGSVEREPRQDARSVGPAECRAGTPSPA